MGLSWQLGMMSLAAGLAGNFQLGYLAAVLSQPYIAVENYINASWTERVGTPISVETLSIIVSALNIVNPIAQMMGQMVALYICDKIGRKKTALVGCMIIFPGCLLSFAAKYLIPYVELLFIGRFLWSLADGILVVNQTIWLIEAAPVKYRGSVSSMQEVFASVGMQSSNHHFQASHLLRYRQFDDTSIWCSIQHRRALAIYVRLSNDCQHFLHCRFLHGLRVSTLLAVQKQSIREGTVVKTKAKF
jgi:MFS family permease